MSEFEKVTRYDAMGCCGYEGCYCSGNDNMSDYEHGEWVKSDDYDKLLKAYNEKAHPAEVSELVESLDTALGKYGATIPGAVSIAAYNLIYALRNAKGQK